MSWGKESGFYRFGLGSGIRLGYSPIFQAREHVTKGNQGRFSLDAIFREQRADSIQCHAWTYWREGKMKKKKRKKKEVKYCCEFVRFFKKQFLSIGSLLLLRLWFSLKSPRLWDRSCPGKIMKKKTKLC